jgi:hypothetical protein
VGRLPRYTSLADLSFELKGIAGYHGENWTFVLNPVAGLSVAGEGKGGPPDLALNGKLEFKLNERWNAGLEHYGDLGSSNRIGPVSKESQLLFAYAIYKHKDWELNAGIGRGLTAVSDQWTLKIVLTFGFGGDGPATATRHEQ